MKKVIFTIFTCLFLFICNAQDLKQIDKSHTDLNQFIAKILHYQKQELDNYLIKTFIVTGKLVTESTETHEYKNDIYVSICEFDENAECRLFLIQDLINIKVEAIVKERNIISLNISYGNYSERIQKNFKITAE